MEPLREKSLRPFVQHLFGDIMSVEEAGRVRAKQQDDNIALLLSQYFRKDLKQSDSVLEDVDIVILGQTSFPFHFFSFFTSDLICVVSQPVLICGETSLLAWFSKRDI